MKRGMLLLALGFIFSLSLPAQTGVLPDSLEMKKNPSLCGDIGIGYVPKTIEGAGMFDAWRMSLAVNNFFLERFGAWTAFEKNFDSGYFRHIIGLTASVNHWMYVYAGMDFFTKEGFFANEGLEKTRKDVGIGFYPFDWLVVKTGWSHTAGFTAEAGIRIPLGPLKVNYVPKKK